MQHSGYKMSDVQLHGSFVDPHQFSFSIDSFNGHTNSDINREILHFSAYSDSFATNIVPFTRWWAYRIYASCIVTIYFHFAISLFFHSLIPRSIKMLLIGKSTTLYCTVHMGLQCIERRRKKNARQIIWRNGLYSLYRPLNTEKIIKIAKGGKKRQNSWMKNTKYKINEAPEETCLKRKATYKSCFDCRCDLSKFSVWFKTLCCFFFSSFLFFVQSRVDK